MIELIEKRLRKPRYSRLEWSVNDFLQLQRLAHEEIGFGTWDGCAGDSTVPVTDKDETLAVLDMSDLQHLRLKVKTSLKENGQAVGEIDSSSAQEESRHDSTTETLETASDGRMATGDEHQTNRATGEDRLLGVITVSRTESHPIGRRGDASRTDTNDERVVPSERNAQADGELPTPTESHEANGARGSSS